MVVTMAVSVAQPTVLVATAFLALFVTGRVLRLGLLAAAAVSAVLVLGGVREGLWYVERGWALLVAGWFAAFTLRWPRVSFSSRALWAVAGALASAAALLVLRDGAWGTVEWAVTDRMYAGVSTALQLLDAMRDGSLSPALAATVYAAVEAQAAVFPAMLALASMGALGVAWWLYVRLSAGSDAGLGPLRDFRFNDHLVWVFIAGLVLMLVQAGSGEARVGANAVVFMGLLYAIRGAAVMMFVSNGLSLAGYVLAVLGLVFVPPVVLGAAMIVGIADTWLDVRSRVPSEAV